MNAAVLAYGNVFAGEPDRITGSAEIFVGSRGHDPHRAYREDDRTVA